MMIKRFFVPGRIELVGKHVDYAGGASLTCAIDRGLTATVTALDEPVLRLKSASRGDEFSLPLDGQDVLPAGHWGIYAQSALRRLARDFPSLTQGLSIEIESTLPESSGLSSSSALTVAVASAIVEFNGLDQRPEWRSLIPNDIGRAEYYAALETGTPYRELPGDTGVGVAGGAQDHIAIVCAQTHHCGYFSYLPARHLQYVPWPAEYLLAVAVSGVTATKTTNAREQYNRASNSLSALLRAFNAVHGTHFSTLNDALNQSPDNIAAMLQMAERGLPGFDGVYLKGRLEQFIQENYSIAPGAVNALKSGDLVTFGELVERSQQLADIGLRNQVPETRSLVTLAAQNGAIASSAFGAGFGGAVWSMVRASEAAEFLTRWSDNYVSLFPAHRLSSQFFLTRPSSAASPVEHVE